MNTQFRKLMERLEVSAAMTVIAMLVAGILTKLGHGWWGIAVMVALCFLDIVWKPKPTTGGPAPRHALEPVRE